MANNAAASVVNTAKVSGGGEVNTSNDTASDPTTITAVARPDGRQHPRGRLSSGANGGHLHAHRHQQRLRRDQRHGDPHGHLARRTDGDGHQRRRAGRPPSDTLTATRSDALAKGASYPPITVTVNVAADAPASVVNTVQVSGGGETNTGNDTANDPTTITPPSSVPQIVGTDLSVHDARDGQTIIVRYQISSNAAAVALAGLHAGGPGGEVIEDATNSGAVNVAPGTAWYTRSFTVNLPPKASLGAYDVTWKIHSDLTGDASVTQTGRSDDRRGPVRADSRSHVSQHRCAVSDDFFTVSTADFQSQMRALKAYGYTAVSLQDVLDYRAGVKTPPAKPFMLTFDDGYESLLTTVLADHLRSGHQLPRDRLHYPLDRPFGKRSRRLSHRPA